MDGNESTRSSSVMLTDDADTEFEVTRKVAKNSHEYYPDAFVHAIRHAAVRNFSLTEIFHDESNSYYPSRTNSLPSRDNDSTYSSEGRKFREQLTMMQAESVIATLTNVQENQLRRVRDDTSTHLEDILRNVVKTIDAYYANQFGRDDFIPTTSDEDEDEMRIRKEVRKILKGDIGVVERNQKVVETRKKSKNTEELEKDEQTNIVGTVPEKFKAPVCQAMLKVLDNLWEASASRRSILAEVLEWMKKCISEAFPELPDIEDEFMEINENNSVVRRNIRRLTLLSEKMGLAKIDGDVTESDEDKERRKSLEESMKKKKSKHIATKVFDIESLRDLKNWKSAASAINQTLEDASSNASGNQRNKLVCDNAFKQFRFMTALAEKRQEEKTKLDLQLNNVTGKLNRERNEVKSLKKEKQALETQLENFKDDIVELNKEMETRDNIITKNAEQIYELEVLNEEQEQSLKQERESKRQPPPVVQHIIIQQPAPSQQQPPQQQVTTTQPTTNTAASKEEAQKEKQQTEKQQTEKQQTEKQQTEKQQTERQQTVSQTPKKKSTKKVLKDAVAKAKKEMKEEEENRKKEEDEKEKARRTSVMTSLKEAKAELVEFKTAKEARGNELKDFKMKLETETGRFEEEKSKLEGEIQFHKLQVEAGKKQLELEQEAWERTKNEMLQERDKLTYQLQAKEEMIDFQEQRIQEVAREMTLSLMRAGLQTANAKTGRGGNATDKLLESKQMLAKLHLQYEFEMQRLKKFVKRESERHQAENRRLESEYRSNLSNVYRDTSVIFRALNRFKQCLAALFDRENLTVVAHGIRNLPNLLEDETGTDPQIKLLRMAGGITEQMVQMEFKMSQALINKRMEIKDSSLTKNFLNKDLEAKEELLKKARELGILQAEKLKQAREEIASQESQLLRFKRGETNKYVDMMERNKELTRHNQILNKELTYLQKQLQEETSLKERQRQDMDKINNEMQMKIGEQAATIASLKSGNAQILSQQNLHLKNSDMMRNIKLLNDALVAKKLSEEKHTVAMTIVVKTMDVIGTRLAYLVRKYILHKRWKKICEAMRKHHRSIKRPNKVERYLNKMELRIAEEKEKLAERKAEMLQQKTEMYLHFKQMCNELNEENSVQLTRPTVNKKVDSTLYVPQIHDQQVMIYKKPQDHIKKMLHRPSAGDYGRDRLDGVTGFKFFVSEETDTAQWQVPQIETTQSSIVTPKLVDIDMQRARESCQRVLTSKSCGNFDVNKTWNRRQKMRESLLTLPPIASLYDLYPET